MKRLTFRSRMTGALGVAGASVVAIASIFVATAAAAPPGNTVLPAITGAAVQGGALTTDNGTWSNTPTSYTYQWNRCNSSGASCVAIAGATASSYQLVSADVGQRLRSVVTAKNTDGQNTATSNASDLVQALPTGCPVGTGVLPVDQIQQPAHLDISSNSATPSTLTRSTQQVVTHFTITACGGRPVQGALVYATAVPWNQFSVPPEGTTDANGKVDLTMSRLKAYPATKQQEFLAVFVRARKASDPILAGISARELDSFPVNLTK